MIEPTGKMVDAFWAGHDDAEDGGTERGLAAVLAIVERDQAAGPELYAVVWHSPYEATPDGQVVQIVTNKAEAVEDAVRRNAETRRARQRGAGDHRYAAYRLVPLDTPDGTP